MHVFIFLGYMSASRISRSYNNYDNYLRNYQTGFQSDYHFTVPLIRSEVSNFFTSLSTLAVIFLLDYSYPSGCEVVYHCGFNSHFYMASDVEHLFVCLMAVCVSSLQ